MARFKGLVGFAHTVRADGVSEEVITEKGPYKGDVKRESRTLTQNGEKINSDLTTTNMIEIIADAYLSDNFFAIRYVEWAGTLWRVAEATVQRPRLLLRLGGVYVGDRPARDPAAEGTPGTP